MVELDITKKNPMLTFMVGAGLAYFTYYFLCVVKVSGTGSVNNIWSLVCFGSLI